MLFRHDIGDSPYLGQRGELAGVGPVAQTAAGVGERVRLGQDAAGDLGGRRQLLGVGRGGGLGRGRSGGVGGQLRPRGVLRGANSKYKARFMETKMLVK